MDLLKRIAQALRDGRDPKDLARELGVSDEWMAAVLASNALALLE